MSLLSPLYLTSSDTIAACPQLCKSHRCCVCVCACVLACMHACVCVCMRVCVCVLLKSLMVT